MTDQVCDPYRERNQAKIKHMLLQSYLVRLFMILGQREPVINYVDCFAGPWQSELEDLSDTSIGVACAEMNKCLQGLRKSFNKEIKFRAIFIEKDPQAFSRLSDYVKKNTSIEVELSCFQGEFLDLIPEIAGWADGNFTFFFVDPLGWKDITASKMAPLLRLPKSEFLINFMYDFANRSIAQPEKFEAQIKELLGYLPDLSQLSVKERQGHIVNLYRECLKSVFGEEAYSSYMPIERPGQDRLLYFLVYLSRHSSGIDAFKQEAEKAEIYQKQLQLMARIEKRQTNSNMVDMFAEEKDEQILDVSSRKESVSIAKNSLLNLLSSGPVKIDMSVWARLLESNACLPSDFQIAVKELLLDGKIKNTSASVERRTAKPLAPKKNEIWQKVL